MFRRIVFVRRQNEGEDIVTDLRGQDAKKASENASAQMIESRAASSGNRRDFQEN